MAYYEFKVDLSNIIISNDFHHSCISHMYHITIRCDRYLSRVGRNTN